MSDTIITDLCSHILLLLSSLLLLLILTIYCSYWDITLLCSPRSSFVVFIVELCLKRQETLIIVTNLKAHAFVHIDKLLMLF